jgi:hypothetical protein
MTVEVEWARVSLAPPPSYLYRPLAAAIWGYATRSLYTDDWLRCRNWDNRICPK